VNIIKLLAALQKKGGFELVAAVPKPTRLQLYGRVQNVDTDRMLSVLYSLLVHSERDTDLTFDGSRQYILKEGRVVYRWRLIFASPNLETRLDQVVAVISGSASPQMQLDEFPLPGAAAHRNNLRNGKGVQSDVDKASVGPRAISRGIGR
jgi:hypothetical protein